MLEGGETAEFDLVPLEALALRKKIETMLDDINDFQEIANETWNVPSISDVRLNKAHRFDMIFHDLISNAEEVKITLKETKRKQWQLFRILQGVLATANILSWPLPS